jgi:hypothetical protein
MFGYIITLPADAASSTLAYVGYLFSDLSTLIILIIGVSLGLIVLEVLLNIFRK